MTEFDEAFGEEILNEWFLLKMTCDEPPTVEELYEQLSEAYR
jgi:hypothetical protein